MKRILLLMLAVVILNAQSPSAAADMKTFSREYAYQAGREDNRDTSRIMALREVKRILLTELTTALEGDREARNVPMAQDQRMAIASGIVLLDISDEQWNGHTFRLKSKLSVDPAEIFKSMDAIRSDPEKMKELEDEWKRSEELLRLGKKLRNDLPAAKGKKRVQDKEAYHKMVKEMVLIDWMEKGYAQANRGRYEQAIQDFGRVIEMDAKHFRAHYNRGTANAQLRRYAPAIQDFNSAIAIDPTYAPALVRRGLASFSLGQHDQAIQDFNQAIELDQKLAIAYNSRGIVNANRGRFDEAIPDFGRALEISPRFVAAYLNRGLAYFNDGKYERSIEDFSRANELDPRLTVAYVYRGLAYFNLGRSEEAVEAYEEAIKLDPRFSVAYYQLARLYARQGDNEKAVSDLKKAINLNPELRTKARSDNEFEKIRQQQDFIDLIGR